MIPARTIGLLLVFWALQIVSQIFFKWGSDTPGRAAWGFLGGQVFGISSIVPLMMLYRAMNVNVAMGIGLGGAFLTSQLAVALVFRSLLVPTQYLGIVAIAAGMFLLAARSAPAP